MKQTITHWLRGIRLYIALGSILATSLTVWWAETAYGGSSLVAIRIEETFAWLALGLLALAVSIGPAYKVFPRLKGKQLFFEARRLIGVSAAWFVSLHVGIAYAALFKAANPLHLPNAYQNAFLLGLIGLMILLAMAFTSFDGAFKGMGVWWFRLHRFIYVAIVVILLHVFMIGVHAGLLAVLGSITVVAGLIMGLYLAIMLKTGRVSVWQAIGVSAMAIALALTLGYGFNHRTIMNKAEGGYAVGKAL